MRWSARVVVPDEVEAIRGAVRDALAAGAAVVLTTGGTGLTPTDVTPEAVRPLLEREVPGIAEALRLRLAGQGADIGALARRGRDDRRRR